MVDDVTKLSKSERDALENQLTLARYIQLQEKPIPGKFDVAHLKAVNHHLFQDLPALGFTHVTPGEFRGESNNWMKTRLLETVEGSSTTVYSRMDAKALKQLDTVLKTVDPKKLRSLQPAEFGKQLGELYAQLDYTHPFLEGNSRTLRAFTYQLAQESGFHLDWEQSARSPKNRDVLYIARDLSLVKVAMKDRPEIMRSPLVMNGFDRFDGRMPDMPELMPRLTMPLRARSYMVEPKEVALKKFPELKGAFELKDVGLEVIKAKYPNQEETQRQLFRSLLSSIHHALKNGEIPSSEPARDDLKKHLQQSQTQSQQVKKPVPNKTDSRSVEKNAR